MCLTAMSPEHDVLVLWSIHFRAELVGYGPQRSSKIFDHRGAIFEIERRRTLCRFPPAGQDLPHVAIGLWDTLCSHA